MGRLHRVLRRINYGGHSRRPSTARLPLLIARLIHWCSQSPIFEVLLSQRPPPALSRTSVRASFAWTPTRRRSSRAARADPTPAWRTSAASSRKQWRNSRTEATRCGGSARRAGSTSRGRCERGSPRRGGRGCAMRRRRAKSGLPRRVIRLMPAAAMGSTRRRNGSTGRCLVRRGG